MGAAAQFGEQQEQTEQDQQRAGEQQQQQQLEHDGERTGELRIGTVDLMAVLEAHKGKKDRDREARDGQRGEGQDRDQQARDGQLGEGQDRGQQARDGQQEDGDLQQPAQAGQDPFGRDAQREDSGIDQETLDEIRQMAREVAGEEGVDMIVLEVLHDDQGSVETIDLTDRVVQRIERGDDQEEDALMGGFGQDEETEDGADAEQNNDEGAVW